MSIEFLKQLPAWQKAIGEAATEIARYALSADGATVGEPVHDQTFAGAIGAHIPLVGSSKFDLAIVTSPEGCDALGRGMLMMGPTDPIREAEVADAVGELANMLAGGVKRRMRALGTDLELGLPKFVRGYVQPTDRVWVIGIPVAFGAIKTHVLVIGK